MLHVTNKLQLIAMEVGTRGLEGKYFSGIQHSCLHSGKNRFSPTAIFYFLVIVFNSRGGKELLQASCI